MAELRTRYKGSFLGFLWTFLNPLLVLMVYSLIFATIMKVAIKDYSVFMFIGLLAWNFFATALQTSSGVVMRQSSLVKKIYFPREVLPISVVGGALINYLLSTIILFIFLLIYGYYPNEYWIFFPIIIIIEFIFTLGLSLLFASITVYLRDIEHIITILLMVWFYLTPVIYKFSMIPTKYDFLFKVNPLTDIIIALQTIFYYRSQPEIKLLGYALVSSLIVLLIGYLTFRKLNRKFAEEV